MSSGNGTVVVRNKEVPSNGPAACSANENNGNVERSLTTKTTGSLFAPDFGWNHRPSLTSKAK